MSDGLDRAFKEGYQRYLQYVDHRDRLRYEDPDRRLAQVCVEASWEMYQTFSSVLRPTPEREKERGME